MSTTKPSQILKRESLDASSAKWVKLVKTTYKDPNGTIRDWESAERCTRPAGIDYDGVGILAILTRPSKPPALLLQKQFRPPIGKVCIEIPAGLIDANETPEDCALRELHEETGYYGSVINEGEGGGVSPLFFNDPGMCNTNTLLVDVRIDLDDERNKNPVPKLEDNEFIDCFEIELGRLYEECKKLEKEGFAIDARVGTIGQGIEIAKRWKLT